MDNASYVALSGAMALRRSVDITANNVANMNTVGFKGERATFQEYLHRGEGGARNGTSFVLDQASYLDDRQGGLVNTGNPLNVAVTGTGYLSYLTDTGEQAFGRDGRFAIDNLGNLVTLSGAQVLDEGGAPIAIPEDAGEIAISADGMITDQNGNELGILGVFEVPEIQSYQRLGDGMFAPQDPQAQPNIAPSETSTVSQGFVESSNIAPIAEMTKMMDIQRAYDRANKMIESVDQMREKTISRLGRM